MDNESIILNAPEGATHVDEDLDYWDEIECLTCDYSFICSADMHGFRSLSDIRRIVELEEALKNAELDANGQRVMKTQAREQRDDVKQRLQTAERERDEALKWVANFQNCSTKECMCGSDMNVTCGHCGCVSTVDYYAFPRARQLLNKFAIEQQIKGVEDAIKFSDDNSNFVDSAGLEDYLDSQLRQQLNGGE